MEKLQSNYTTQEISKKLMLMGLPDWTADCFYDHFGYKQIRDCLNELRKDFFENAGEFNECHEGAIPCWSAGRLLELYNNCVLNYDEDSMVIPKGHFVLQKILIELFAALEYKYFDFSKLKVYE